MLSLRKKIATVRKSIFSIAKELRLGKKSKKKPKGKRILKKNYLNWQKSKLDDLIYEGTKLVGDKIGILQERLIERANLNGKWDLKDNETAKTNESTKNNEK